MKKLAIAMCLMVPAASASAVQNLKLGGVEVKPVVIVTEKYDSNIYLTKDLVRASYFNRSSVGLGFMNNEAGRLNVTGAYTLEVLNYARDYRSNNAVHQTGELGLKEKLAGDRTIALNDKYMTTTDQATSELTQRARRISNVAGLEFLSPLKGKFGFGIDATHTINDYLSSNNKTLDRDEILAGVSVDYKLQPKTKVFAAYHFGSLKYEERTLAGSNDAVYSNVDLGMTGNIAPKLTGTVAGGAQFRLYRKDLNDSSNSRTTGGYSAQLKWLPMAKSEVIWYGKRANIESTFGDSRFYTSTINDLSCTHEINKFKAGVGVGYEDVRYPEETIGTNAKRHDGNSSVRASLDYNIQKWLKAGVSHTYKTRMSNEHGNNYVDNVSAIEIKGLF